MYAVKAKIPVHTLVHVCHKFTLYEGIHDQTVLCLKSYLLSLKTYMYSLLFDSSAIFITLVRLRCWIPDAGRRLHQLCPWMGHLMLSLAVCSVVASSCYNSDRKGLLRDRCIAQQTVAGAWCEPSMCGGSRIQWKNLLTAMQFVGVFLPGMWYCQHPFQGAVSL